jgi:two-component system phosphate regulon sensor histidine kinase PhoR
MKPKSTLSFIIISSLALLSVLIIQVNWIFQTAKIKEEIFNEKANMVLARTTEALSLDKETCKKIEECIEKVETFGAKPKIGNSETFKIDSLLKHFMKFYNFYIDYNFEIKPGSLAQKGIPLLSNNAYPAQPGCYKKELDEITGKNGFELKLIFPKKEEFIIREMGVLFITSVVLIIVVLIMFWKTILYLQKEKKLSEHTNDFLNNMTHEFKTPITNIALASKMLLKDFNTVQTNSIEKRDEKTKHYSEIILEENEKLRLQVEQVLSMTALERGEIPLQKTELNFHQLIHHTLKYMNIQIENKQGQLKLNLDATSVNIIGDKTHLTNSLSNLIDNAIKYSKGNPEIQINTFNIEKKLIVKFSDNGIGIENEYKKKVFDKFFRVPTGDLHNVKGFGLGLAYVKKIIELHGGTIELESWKDKGTQFTITLLNA